MLSRDFPQDIFSPIWVPVRVLWKVLSGIAHFVLSSLLFLLVTVVPIWVAYASLTRLVVRAKLRLSVSFSLSS